MRGRREIGFLTATKIGFLSVTHPCAQPSPGWGGGSISKLVGLRMVSTNFSGIRRMVEASNTQDATTGSRRDVI